MEKEQRSKLQKATQEARRLLEEEFSRQLLETYDINVAAGRWSEEPGAHLQAEQRLLREKLLAWIEHRSAQIKDEKEALLLALREMAFTALNRFVALKLMEARELVRPCISGGLESEGFQEFTAVAQGLLVEQESSYRLYLETIFEDVSRELRALFDPRDTASLLWPKRTALLDLLDILNRPELAELWREDETLGWIYQYFNGDAERKKMREESAAPRNSRELAVRNQFFTPRYVVEFLTDNTLGRIWYEMRQGDTGLKERCRYLVRRPIEIWLQPGEEAPAEVVADEALSQEELLSQPVHIPCRPLKDPREIRMLDPACGSMHFGLYSFDLYLAIYEEAWEIAQSSDEQAKQEEAFAAFVAYAAGFAGKAAFLHEVPRLILLHNIHGVDIDPRATQIARLTLWLRAQRAWQEQGVEVAARPAITRSNVVCAEPMPGEKEILREFIEQQFPSEEQTAFGFLLEKVFDLMKLAGEAGSLLRIEEEIRSTIAEAKRLWKAEPQYEQRGFFAEDLPSSEQASLSLGLSSITDDQFWEQAEQRIYTALQTYAERAENGSGFQRRLFAHDAARGFAFVDTCRNRYDAVVMNPPFGEETTGTTGYLNSAYPTARGDLYAVFVDRGVELLLPHHRLGVISSRTGFFAPLRQKWREATLLTNAPLDLVADLGSGVLDTATVDVASYVVHKESSTKSAKFIDLRDQDDKRMALAREISQLEKGKSTRTTIFAHATAWSLPKSGILYDASASLINKYISSKTFAETFGATRNGFGTLDDFRFLRTRSEVSLDMINNTWFPASKGAVSRPFYGDNIALFKWHENGAELKQYVTDKVGSASRKVQSEKYYFTAGLTWGRRTSGPQWFSVLPKGCAFTDNGPIALVPLEQAITALGVCSSSQFRAGLRARSSRGGKGSSASKVIETGHVASCPDPSSLDPSIRKNIESECSAGLAAAMKLTSYELESSLFVVPGALKADLRKSSLLESVNSALIHYRSLVDQINNSLEAIDMAIVNSEAIEEVQNGEDVCRLDGAVFLPTSENLTRELFNYLLGSVLGRWDFRFVAGSRDFPASPDPFEPLPIGPPGMLKNKEGMAAKAPEIPSEYPLHISWSGILVDDEFHQEDLVGCIRQSIKTVWGQKTEDIEQEACEFLGTRNLREYFGSPDGFFDCHLKVYTKSRRQAPIYWQLSAGNGNYSAWLYYHRFTQDTLYRVLGDFVDPRIQEAEREQFEFESQGGLSGDAASLLHEVQTLLQDLRLFKSELELVAPLWNPNLNDGVIINHAILWRITPHAAWQKKCKECWDKLVKGDYDWAHLAFHLWPERVIRKCTIDRSLAVAHGLEERLWQEANNGNWLQRQLPEAELQALLAEYSKPAVQNALERFLAAPPPVAAARTRAPRATKSSSTGTTRRPRGSAPEVDAETSRQTLLVLTAAPAEGLGRNAIAELLGVEAASLTAVIKQLKEGGQIEQLGAARGAKYRLSESGLAAVESQAGEDE
ncbi:MAG: BREX-1 system adenine-specific DNA-methyltransferase PglX [Cyanobium usitatum Tobar12.5m-G36]|nr:BREX-1 system adenine-specific DNA-methyltransferase PglX [Cyanobium usitatum Tobar12.5m-G36]